MTLAHWDDVERTRREVGDMRSWWREIGAAAGATEIGVSRVEIDPGMRIGPVYTPPAFRGRSYATTLTADVSAAQLAAGRRFCFLYTDLANPTSNAIYERIGYRKVAEAAEVVFG